MQRHPGSPHKAFTRRLGEELARLGYPSLPRVRLAGEDFPGGAPDQAADEWALAMQDAVAAEANAILEAIEAEAAAAAGPAYTSPFGSTPSAERGLPCPLCCVALA